MTTDPTNPAENPGGAPGEGAASAEPPEAPAPEPVVGWLPSGASELFGEGASAEESYGLLTVDVLAAAWIAALETARDTLGCTYFDWLSAVDEPGTGFRVCAHVVALPTGPGAAGAVRRLVVRTTVPHDAPALPSAIGVYAGAAWHERETFEMFGVDFTGHPHLVPLLLPEGFEGHPLRKDFVLAARVAKAWPGAKEPGETEGGGPKRRQMLPPGVPDPNEWGPLKGQLPPAPARPARGPRAAGAAAADRPARRTRSVAAGSASQTEPAAGTPAAAPERPARRSRSVSEGSASQAAPAAEAAGAEGSVSQQAEPTAGTPDTATAAGTPARRSRSASEGSASQATPPAEAGTPAAERPRPTPRSADAPWHHARPAFDETPNQTPGEPGPEAGAPKDATPQAEPAAEPTPEAEPGAAEPPPGEADRPEPGAADPPKGDGDRDRDTRDDDPAGGHPA
ncbi:NADH-quinone oxidoreductase subunit C [Streptomyces sp. QH1-20]|uniref:NADH-quinone oxidoreductase subunit C n=1 Tax=Streptomyces sp. QH1-20 TaxID=3240934 RepID=UPI00351338E2